MERTTLLKLLSITNEATIREVLGREFPELTVRSMHFLQKREDRCTIEVNEQLIFKFPFREKAWTEIVREQWVMNALQGRTSVAIPRPALITQTVRGYGYEKLPGALLTDEYYWSLTEAQKQAFAVSIARFLSELHHALRVADAVNAGLDVPDDPLSPDQLRRRLFPLLDGPGQRSLVERMLAIYEQLKFGAEPRVVLHNDLHGWNILCDPTTAQLTGVLDFNGTCIGDAHLDFRYFFYPDPSLLEIVLTHYTRLSTRKLSLRRCILYAVATDLTDLVYCIEEGRQIYDGPISARIARLEQQLRSYELL